MNRSLRTALLALPLLAASCMPPIRVSTAFSSRFGDNDRAKIATVMERLARGTAPIADRTGLLAAVIQGDARAVALYDVAARRALWTQPMAASSTPEIVGDAVVVEVGSSTVILDLGTGATRGRWEHTGLDLVGASRDGDTLVRVRERLYRPSTSCRRAARLRRPDASSA